MESPIIGRIISERIRAYIESRQIGSPKILVIGLGPIGNAVLQIFKEEKSNVLGFDTEKNKGEIIQYLKDEKPDVVIGATGVSLFEEADLALLEDMHTYHFISVSSSDREFPVARFRSSTDVHEDVFYKNFIFVNNGFPITFKGNAYESTPVEIEKTIALLMGSVLHGAANGLNGESGLIEVPEELETLINS